MYHFKLNRLYATDDLDWLPNKDQWANLRSIVMVVSERTIREKASKEIRFYLSSLAVDAGKIAYAIRTHWGIDNKVHWMLDVVFRMEPKPRKRTLS